MKRSNVSSSVIASVGYDAKSATLELVFHTGGIYQYYGVPSMLYEQLLTADSIGKFFHEHILDVFPYHRVR